MSTNHGEKLIQEVFDRIEHEHIRPTPRWRFLARNLTLWFSGFFSVMIGGMAISVLLFVVDNSDWDLYEYAFSGVTEFLVVMSPYIWLISLIFFMCVAYYQIKHTERGYRYNFFTLLSVVIIMSGMIGVGAYSLRLGGEIDAVVSEYFEDYYGESLLSKKQQFWMRPRQGYLSGEVVSVSNNNAFSIRDWNDQLWDISGNNLISLRDILLKQSDRVRIIGVHVASGTFRACLVKPWIIKGPSGYGERNAFELRSTLCE